MIPSHPTLSPDHLKISANGKFKSFSQNMILTYSGSGAIYLTLKSLAPGLGRTVLAPAFHCPSVIEPIVHAGYKVEFYKIKDDLTIDLTDLFARINADTAAVLVVHHFGFPVDIAPILGAKKKHSFILIEDWAHSFLSDNSMKDRGDAEIYTFYKQVASQAGGAVRVNNDQLVIQPPGKRDSLLNSAVMLKTFVDELVHNSQNKLWGNIYGVLSKIRDGRKKGETSAETTERESFWHIYQFNQKLAAAKMPWLSKRIINNSDFEKIKSARRSNYQIFSNNLVETENIAKVYPDLPEDVSPWAFAVLIKNRLQYDYKLREMGVPLFTYGETLHPKFLESKGSDIETAISLSNSLLLFSIHQNISRTECREIVKKINVFFAAI